MCVFDAQSAASSFDKACVFNICLLNYAGVSSIESANHLECQKEMLCLNANPLSELNML